MGSRNLFVLMPHHTMGLMQVQQCTDASQMGQLFNVESFDGMRPRIEPELAAPLQHLQAWTTLLPAVAHGLQECCPTPAPGFRG